MGWITTVCEPFTGGAAKRRELLADGSKTYLVAEYQDTSTVRYTLYIQNIPIRYNATNAIVRNDFWFSKDYT